MSPTRSQDERDGADTAAHDVLAAEEFALPVADPTIHPRPVVLPDDPSGIGEPHDVLAAEEFAMPAVHPHPNVVAPRQGSPSRAWLIAVGAFALLRVLRRRRRRPGG
jgi:hypothetical protein